MFSARQIRLSKSRRKSSSMITWWSPTTSRSRHESKQLNQCRNRWQPSDWFAHACLIDWIVILALAPTIVLHFATLSSCRLASCVEARFGIDNSSRILTFGMDRWRKLRGDLAVKLACILKFFAISWCWMCLWRFLRSGINSSGSQCPLKIYIKVFHTLWPYRIAQFTPRDLILSLFLHIAVSLFFHKSFTMASKLITITQLLATLQVFQVSTLSTS